MTIRTSTTFKRLIKAGFYDSSSARQIKNGTVALCGKYGGATQDYAIVKSTQSGSWHVYTQAHKIAEWVDEKEALKIVAKHASKRLNKKI